MLERVVVAGAIERQVSSLGGQPQGLEAGGCDKRMKRCGRLGESRSVVRIWNDVRNWEPTAGNSANYTAALEHLGNCGGSDVMHEGIGGNQFMECVPSQLLMCMWGRQNTAVDVFLVRARGCCCARRGKRCNSVAGACVRFAFACGLFSLRRKFWEQ